MQLLNPLSASQVDPLPYAFGQPLSIQPRVLVKDKFGNPLVGKRVVALTAAPMLLEYVFAFLHVRCSAAYARARW